MPTTAVFLDTEAFDTTWHLGLPYKLSELKFSISLISLLALSFLRENSRDIQAGVLQGSVLYPSYDRPQTPGFYLGLFADDTCIYATDHKGGYALRKAAVRSHCY
jgi:hypothetical protein